MFINTKVVRHLHAIWRWLRYFLLRLALATTHLRSPCG